MLDREGVAALLRAAADTSPRWAKKRKLDAEQKREQRRDPAYRDAENAARRKNLKRRRAERRADLAAFVERHPRTLAMFVALRIVGARMQKRRTRRAEVARVRARRAEMTVEARRAEWVKYQRARRARLAEAA